MAVPEDPRSGTFPLSIGAVAQLGERLVRNEEVRGSIPLGSTKSHGKSLFPCAIRDRIEALSILSSLTRMMTFHFSR